MTASLFGNAIKRRAPNPCHKKARRIKGSLYPLPNARSKLNTRNKIHLYKSIIRPTITYVAEAQKPDEEKTLYKLQVIQNLTLRLNLNVPYYVSNNLIHGETNVPKLYDLINKLNKNLMENQKEHANPTIKNLVPTIRKAKRRKLH